MEPEMEDKTLELMVRSQFTVENLTKYVVFRFVRNVTNAHVGNVGY